MRKQVNMSDLINVEGEKISNKFVQSAAPAIGLSPHILQEPQQEDKTFAKCAYYNHQILVHANESDFKLSHMPKSNRKQANEGDICWPHILKGNSLVLVKPKSLGRTWSYLPAICTLVQRIMKDQSKRHVGPIAILLVANPIDAYIVHETCKNLLESENSLVVAKSGEENNEIRSKLMQGCGVLITTKPYLELLLAQNMSETLFDFECLNHIIIDSIDLLNRFNPNEFQLLLGKLLKMCSRTVAEQRIINQQLIVTTQSWDSNLLPVLLRTVRSPLLIFGDFLEAIIYGSVSLKIWVTKLEERNKVLLETLEERFNNSSRTVIFCKNNADVAALDEFLTTAGYKCLNGISPIGIENELILWKNSLTEQILICTDQFEALQVQNAHHIIHYNLPNCCYRFKQRHSAIVANYRNWLLDAEITLPTQQKVDVLIDERNHVEVPLLIELLLKQNTPINPYLLETFKKNKQRRNINEHANFYYKLCPEVAIFGNCNFLNCKRRHLLTQMDLQNKTQLNFIPNFGVVEVEIIDVFTPTHFAVRPLSHRWSKNAEWCTKLITFDEISSDLKLYYESPRNQKTYWPPIVGDICVSKVDECYQRVRILEVPNHLNKLKKNISVIGQFVDKITGVFPVDCEYLWICPEQYKEMSPLIIDLRLTAVVPLAQNTLEIRSTLNKMERITSWLQTKDSFVSMRFEAIIDCAMAHTIYVSNLLVYQECPYNSSSTCLLDLKQVIDNQKTGCIDKNAKLNLNRLFDKVKQKACY